jgi:hypothetical protein
MATVTHILTTIYGPLVNRLDLIGRRNGVWQVIYIAPSRQVAEQLKEALSQEGVLVSLRTAGVSTGENAQVELLVPKGEAREAHELLNQALSRARFTR